MIRTSVAPGRHRLYIQFLTPVSNADHLKGQELVAQQSAQAEEAQEPVGPEPGRAEPAQLLLARELAREPAEVPLEQEPGRVAQAEVPQRQVRPERGLAEQRPDQEPRELPQLFCKACPE
jgi:hypothetical protein